jgi:antitoxin PrlF
MAIKVTIVRGRGQITIPADVREAAHLEEGDSVEVEMTPEGILLRPRKAIDSTQAWFWTPSWQAGEREATEDVRAGRIERHLSDREFLKSLD